jgi:micrococcal nuclease
LKYIAVALCLFGLGASQAFAHPGKTNSSGCHNNRKTGQYHCHGGSSASTTKEKPQTAKSAESMKLKVISVGDGDTFRATGTTGERVTVRLACIDAPELKQNPYGNKSRDYLRQLIPVGQSVQASVVDTDKYGRKVAIITAGGKNVNLNLVRAGHAAVYREYLSNCSDIKQELLSAEATAKSAGLEFWSQSNPTLPKDFRRQQ